MGEVRLREVKHLRRLWLKDQPINEDARKDLQQLLLEDENNVFDQLRLAKTTIYRAAVGLRVHQGTAFLIETTLRTLKRK